MCILLNQFSCLPNLQNEVRAILVQNLLQLDEKSLKILQKNEIPKLFLHSDAEVIYSNFHQERGKC